MANFNYHDYVMDVLTAMSSESAKRSEALVAALNLLGDAWKMDDDQFDADMTEIDTLFPESNDAAPAAGSDDTTPAAGNDDTTPDAGSDGE